MRMMSVVGCERQSRNRMIKQKTVSLLPCLVTWNQKIHLTLGPNKATLTITGTRPLARLIICVSVCAHVFGSSLTSPVAVERLRERDSSQSEI